MEDDNLIEEMASELEENGEIRISNEEKDIYIHTNVDDEGNTYVSNTNLEFDGSKEAVEWAVEQFEGIEKISDWE